MLKLSHVNSMNSSVSVCVAACLWRAQKNIIKAQISAVSGVFFGLSVFVIAKLQHVLTAGCFKTLDESGSQQVVLHVSWAFVTFSEALCKNSQIILKSRV